MIPIAHFGVRFFLTFCLYIGIFRRGVGKRKRESKLSGFAAESFSGFLIYRERMQKGGSGAAKGKRVKVKSLIVLAKAEANDAVASGGPVVAAIGAAQVHGVAEPTAAAQHAVGAAFRACWILIGRIFIIIELIPIITPFPDVSCKII